MSNPLIWKTMTLAENHTSDATGTVSYWCDYTGVSSQTDFDKYVYILVFDHHSDYPSYGIDFIATTKDPNNTVKYLYARDQWANAYAGGNRSAYAKAGATITVYRIPR